MPATTSILNQANCGNTANTGVNSCDNQPGKPQYVVAIPKGFVIPATNLTDTTTFSTAFKAYFEADSRAARFWLSPLLTNMEAQGGDAVTENRDNYEFTVQFKPYNWSFLLNGSKCDYNNWANLVQFNQSKLDFLVIDDRGQIWYRPATDSTGAQGAGGFSLAEVSVPNWTPANQGKNLAKYPFRMQFANNSQIVNAGFISANTFPDATWGLVTTVLSKGSTANTTTNYFVKGFMGCGATSIGSAYGATLAAATGWVLKDVTSSTTITPSAVAYLPDTDEYKFTVTAATTGDTISIKLAAPSILMTTPFNLVLVPITETALTFTSL